MGKWSNINGILLPGLVVRVDGQVHGWKSATYTLLLFFSDLWQVICPFHYFRSRSEGCHTDYKGSAKTAKSHIKIKRGKKATTGTTIDCFSNTLVSRVQNSDFGLILWAVMLY